MVAGLPVNLHGSRIMESIGPEFEMFWAETFSSIFLPFSNL
jgi:hypothetical protein